MLLDSIPQESWLQPPKNIRGSIIPKQMTKAIPPKKIKKVTSPENRRSRKPSRIDHHWLHTSAQAGLEDDRAALHYALRPFERRKRFEKRWVSCWFCQVLLPQAVCCFHLFGKFASERLSAFHRKTGTRLQGPPEDAQVELGAVKKRRDALVSLFVSLFVELGKSFTWDLGYGLAFGHQGEGENCQLSLECWGSNMIEDIW